jgi:hypothetical protein
MNRSLTLDERIMFRGWFARKGLAGMVLTLRTARDATFYWGLCYGPRIDKRYTVRLHGHSKDPALADIGKSRPWANPGLRAGPPVRSW